MAGIQSRVLDYVGRPAESGLLSIIILVVVALLMTPTIWDWWKLVLGRVRAPDSPEAGILKQRPERSRLPDQSRSTFESTGVPDVD